ncbi:MAG: signal peptidase II [Pikeienuella sp.]
MNAAAKASRDAARLLGLAVLIVAIDRASKLYILEVIDLPLRLRVPVFEPYLVFLYAENRGINFGLLGSGNLRWVLVAIAGAAAVGVTIWALRRREPVFSLGAALVAGGALGNAWDRVQYGFVVDFLNMSCCGIQNPFAFNIADVAIFFGAVIIAWRA